MKTQSAFTAVVTTLLSKHQTGCGTSATLVEKHLGDSNMKGYIKIEATTHEGQKGFAVETHVQNVSTADVIQVLDAVCQTLHVPNKECNEVSFDMEELMRQIKRGDDGEG